MRIEVNHAAINAQGLWRTAYRLHRKTGMSTDRIFMKLLRARVQYLGREGMLVAIM